MTRVMLDACVLVPITLADLLLNLADAEWFVPVWSSTVLDEVERTLIGAIGLDATSAARRIAAMDAAFPYASVSGWEPIAEQARNHPKDRHVLAAAISGEADVLVTANLRDFRDVHPATDLPVMTADGFLRDLIEDRLDATRQIIDLMSSRTSRPRRAPNDIIARLATTAPNTAALLLQSSPVPMPVPLVEATADAAMASMFPTGAPDLTTPRGAGFLWWLALHDLDEFREAAGRASANPSVWGDFTEASTALNGWSFMEKEHPHPETPDAVVYLQLMPDPGFVAQAFGDHPLPDIMVITTVRCPDGLWRVWGLSRNHRPTLEEIFRTRSSN